MYVFNGGGAFCRHLGDYTNMLVLVGFMPLQNMNQ